MKKLDALLQANPSYYIRVNAFEHENGRVVFYSNVIDSKDDLIVELKDFALVQFGHTATDAIENMYSLVEYGA